MMRSSSMIKPNFE